MVSKIEGINFIQVENVVDYLSIRLSCLKKLPLRQRHGSKKTSALEESPFIKDSDNSKMNYFESPEPVVSLKTVLNVKNIFSWHWEL